MTFNVKPHFGPLLVDFPCYLHGSTMMTRKDNDFLTYWNDGFAKIQSSGKFKKLCDEAVKNHGEHIFNFKISQETNKTNRQDKDGKFVFFSKYKIHRQNSNTKQSYFHFVVPG